MVISIKRFFRKLNSDSLAFYYHSRLERAKSAVEAEAIRYTQPLISLYEWDEADKGEEQK